MSGERLKAWGYWGDETEGVARVTSAHGDYFHVVCDEKPEGEAIARTKSSAFRDIPPPVTGDFVRFVYNPHGESRITEVLPRISALERLDPSSSGFRSQTLAVNFDTLFFAMAMNGNASVARLERMLALAEGRLAEAQAIVEDAGVPVQTLAIKNFSPAEAIISTAESKGCDCIFMASHGRKGLAALILGSETQRVLAYSKLPVIVYR